MKLINTMLVGVFAFSMLFAQPPTGGQQPPPCLLYTSDAADE